MRYYEKASCPLHFRSVRLVTLGELTCSHNKTVEQDVPTYSGQVLSYCISSSLDSSVCKFGKEFLRVNWKSRTSVDILVGLQYFVLVCPSHYILFPFFIALLPPIASLDDIILGIG